MAATSSDILLNLFALSIRGSGIDPTLWYVTRAAGVSAYVLLAVVVDMGILLSLARQLETRVSWVFDELHQFLALLAAAMIALHLGVLLIDPFITFSFANLLLPFGEPYQPLGISVGVLGLYALLILLVSSWLRRFIPRRIWRALHFVSFAAFVLVTRSWVAGRQRCWSRLATLRLLCRNRRDILPHHHAPDTGTTERRGESITPPTCPCRNTRDTSN